MTRTRRSDGFKDHVFGPLIDLLKCSFCGKSQKQVKKLIAGPGVYICDECIDLCNEIIEEELAESSEVKLDELPKPAEIDQLSRSRQYSETVSQLPVVLGVKFLGPRPAPVDVFAEQRLQ